MQTIPESKFFERETVEHTLNDPSQVIPLLQKVQEKEGYIPEKAIEEISEITGVSISNIFSVITFYKQFRLRPPGKFMIRVCDGTACHVNDARTLLDILNDELKLEGTDTTEDGLFTVMPVACLGCCSLAPVIMINEDTHGKLTPQKLRKIIKEYQKKGKETN
ncbi:MAG: NADH-quinone oxidoreductase subunit NuoE [Deltaproteobacteria bacterium]|nr:NADH-quinone oxidoreductase subunit NuoE [Deltaproteobacteria bacterium]